MKITYALEMRQTGHLLLTVKLSYCRKSVHLTSLYHTVQNEFQYVEPGPRSE